MATAENITVDSNNNQVRIEEFTIQDEDLTSFLSEFDPRQQEEAIEQALRIGASALQLVGTSKEIEYVERRFEQLEREFDEELDGFRSELEDRFDEDGKVPRILEKYFGEDGHLDTYLEDTFGTDGRFAERLEEKLGEDGEKIQAALDPDREGTPTYRLQQQISQEIETLKQRLDIEEGRDEIREETPLKGFDFEEQVEKILEDIVYQTPNRVENTSEKTGAVDNSRKGDFVVTLDETDQRIVVEAKNGTFNNTVESEMTEAIENREADFGILVASSLEYLPRTRVGWFSEIDQEYVVVALSEDADDEIEPRFLKFVYHWARTRALLSSVEIDDDINSETIHAELSGIKEAIDDFSNLRTKCTNIEDAVSDIRTKLTGIEDDVMSRITRLETELGVSGE